MFGIVINVCIVTETTVLYCTVRTYLDREFSSSTFLLFSVLYLELVLTQNSVLSAQKRGGRRSNRQSCIAIHVSTAYYILMHRKPVFKNKEERKKGRKKGRKKETCSNKKTINPINIT